MSNKMASAAASSASKFICFLFFVGQFRPKYEQTVVNNFKILRLSFYSTSFIHCTKFYKYMSKFYLWNLRTEKKDHGQTISVKLLVHFICCACSVVKNCEFLSKMWKFSQFSRGNFTDTCNYYTFLNTMLDVVEVIK